MIELPPKALTGAIRGAQQYVTERSTSAKNHYVLLTDGAYRLVHGEGDGLSGLIVDVYGDKAVVQCHSIGMHRQVERIGGAPRLFTKAGCVP
jgi:23S rRNA G2069 N7-methylase RlmK/C1962 C5-methylase RlmI